MPLTASALTDPAALSAPNKGSGSHPKNLVRATIALIVLGERVSTVTRVGAAPRRLTNESNSVRGSAPSGGITQDISDRSAIDNSLRLCKGWPTALITE